MTEFGYYRGIFWRAQETVNISVMTSDVLKEIKTMIFLNESLGCCQLYLLGRGKLYNMTNLEVGDAVDTKLMTVLLTPSLNPICYHIMHTVRFKLLALQAAACAGEERLGCLYEQPTRHHERVDGRPDLHRGVSPDRQSLGIHMHVPPRARRRSAVQRNAAVHDVTT